METINLNETSHRFEKQNIVNKRDKNGIFDEYKCNVCGLTGKSYVLGILNVRTGKPCKIPYKPQRIRIKRFIPCGVCAEDLTVGSEHETVAPPKDRKDRSEIWVQGNGEILRLVYGEYDIINNIS